MLFGKVRSSTFKRGTVLHRKQQKIEPGSSRRINLAVEWREGDLNVSDHRARSDDPSWGPSASGFALMCKLGSVKACADTITRMSLRILPD